jgi:hypothetical protein
VEPDETLEVFDTGVVQAQWRVEPGLGLAIDVVDDRGQPVPRAQVALRIPLDPKLAATLRGRAGGDTDEDRPRYMLVPYTTDARGHCEVAQTLRPGRYLVGPYAGLQGEPLEVELERGMGVVPLTLEVEGDGALLVETVSQDGEPISTGLFVQAYALSDTASLEHGVAGGAVGPGLFHVGPLPQGDYRVEVTDGVNSPFDLAPEGGAIHVSRSGEQRVLVRLDRSAEITGRIVDGWGEPVADTWVSAEPEAGNQGMALFAQLAHPKRVLSDDDGHFRLPDLTPGARFVVHASSPLGERAASAVATAGTSELVLELATAQAAR